MNFSNLPNVTVSHSGSKGKKVISVNGKAWGFALLSHETFWAIYKDCEPDMVVSVANGFRAIEFRVLDIFRGV